MSRLAMRGPARASISASALIARAIAILALSAPAVFASAGCAPVPKPSVLADVDQVRGGAAAAEAKKFAPTAFAHVEKLRREADAAFEEGDMAAAQILGERALAAYARAQALSRIARAEASATASGAALTSSREELAGLEADQAQVAAELNAIELRTKVAVDAQPVVPSAGADPDREKARLAAARSLGLQARLLCGAARLLTASAPAEAQAAPPSSSEPILPAGGAKLDKQLDEALAAVAKLDADLASASVAPIDQASRARAGCLSVLTLIRRAATPVSRVPGAGDALLAKLSAAGTFSPSRDERGVTVTLRGLFKGNALTPAGEARLSELGRVAAAHPAFPVVAVLHQDRELTKNDEPAWRARADLVVRALKAGNASRVEPVLAGAVAPVVDPTGGDRARNARVEIVFVTPETF